MADQHPSPILVDELSPVMPCRLARILDPLYETDVLIVDLDIPRAREHIEEMDHRGKEVAAVAAELTRVEQLEEA